MKFVSSATMRALDDVTIAAGTPGVILMERAGRGVAQWIHSFYGTAFVVLVAGKGNNGGDAFVAARYLQEAGCRIRVLLAGALDELTGDAAEAAAMWQAAGGMVKELPSPEDWSADRLVAPLADVVVDALLGTGSTGAPRGAVGAAVRWINGFRALGKASILSVDLPTGVTGDSGDAPGECVHPDHTLTLGLPKPACMYPERCGSVSLIEIGLDASAIADAPAAFPAIPIDDALRARVWPTRDAHGHKGAFGAVQLIGGACGMGGAISLSARAAVRGGAGLVFVTAPVPVTTAFAATCPEAQWRSPTDSETTLTELAVGAALTQPKVSALAVGPGMGDGTEIPRLVRQVLAHAPVPIVLDADGLNALQGDLTPVASAARNVSVVLTPHPGEMGRLLGCTVADVEADREAAVRRAAEDSGAVVLLKGARTLIASPCGRLAVNLNGNAGMATGGCGDVLTGFIAALLARGVDAFDAAVAAAWQHGHAGDRAAWKYGQDAMSAGSLL